MSGYCVCAHGYGQHQAPRDPFRIAGTSVGVYGTTEAKPLVCCDPDCRCERFRRRRSRWAERRVQPGVLYARKDCWHGPDGLPVCDKRRSSLPHPKMLDPDHESYEPPPSSRCRGCTRWVEAHPDELEKKVSTAT